MNTWHLDDTLIARYAAGATGRAQAASVEAHLIGCHDCRAHIADFALHDSQDRIDRIWAEIVDAVDAPSLNVIERVLRRVGVPDHLARLLMATPALGASWLVAVACVFGMAVMASTVDPNPRWQFVYLVIAPLAPVAGVAVSFGRWGDPSYPVAVAAPFSGLRLVLVRALAVVATSCVLAALGALVLDDGSGVRWLLPALALTGLTVVISGWVDPVVAAAGVTLAWLVSVTVARTQSSVGELFSGPFQLAWAAISFACVIGLVLERDRIAVLGGAL